MIPDFKISRLAQSDGCRGKCKYFYPSRAINLQPLKVFWVGHALWPPPNFPPILPAKVAATQYDCLKERYFNVCGRHRKVETQSLIWFPV